MFEGFERRTVETREVAINLRIGGDGPPLLLLHGYPQTHVMWRHVAPRLAERFTVVAADLRGYGDSGKPAGDDEHLVYSKRSMARDQVEAMERLGFRRFALAGHDRGARVAHRLAADWRDRVTQLAVLDIVPTHKVFATTDAALARAYFHWFFLAQRADLPERLIGCDPDYWLSRMLGAWAAGEAFEPAAMEEYRRCFRDPATIHGTCEDYRAGATIDLEHDEADLARKLECPVLALWGAKSAAARFHDVLAAWRERARKVDGRALDCGHFLPEERPEETAAALNGFFAD